MLVYMLGATVLSAPGLAVAHAPNGSEALRAVAAAPPGAQFDLVLMDNQMPVLCGAQATRELRARGFAGLIVGMTGDPVGSEDRADFESSGLDLCVDKDVHGSNLVRDVIHKARDQGVASVRAERALEQARTAASSLLVVAATRGSR
jgi:CheY-like chemotaxis protein